MKKIELSSKELALLYQAYGKDTILNIIYAIEDGEKVYITGGPSTGKTELARFLYHYTGQGVMEGQCIPDDFLHHGKVFTLALCFPIKQERVKAYEELCKKTPRKK